MPGGVPPDRGACRGVNGEAQCRPACDVEREMGADVDTAQSHQGDGGQGEGAAARAETGQGSHAKDDGHARVPGQVSEGTSAVSEVNTASRRPVILGFAFDGFGIYDNIAMNATTIRVSSLDACNGIFSP